MKNFQRFALCAIVAGSIISCQKDEVQEEAAQPEVQQQVPTTVLEKVRDLYMSPADVVPTTLMDLDGSETKGYMISGDIFATEEHLDEMIALNNNAAEEDQGAKQYRTRALVSRGRTIRVLGYTGNDQNGLRGNMEQGLRWAINNYNRININLRFDLTFGSSQAAINNADMVVFSVPSNGAGGSAGFPSRGLPFNRIRINSATGNANPNVNEHVIGHEIGHAIGFRHTDYFSRQSCGQNTNEGDSGVGAIRIPGTPAGFDPTSLMLSCFNFGVDGEFNDNDIRALRSMYP